MREDLFDDERIDKRFNFFANDKNGYKEKNIYRVVFLSSDSNGTKRIFEMPANRKNIKKGMISEEQFNVIIKTIDELQKEKDALIEENKELKEQVEKIKEESHRLCEKKEEMNAQVVQSEEFLMDEKAYKEELLESQKENEYLKNKVDELEKRIKEYMEERNLPQAISEDIYAVNQKFAEMREMILSLKDKVNYGDKGLAKLCTLWCLCHNMNKDETTVIADQLRYILEDSFNCRIIEPVRGENFDSHVHEATVYNEGANEVDECLMPGWQYNEKVITKAIVKIRQTV